MTPDRVVARMLIEEIPWQDPVAILPLFSADPYLCFLESVSEQDPRSRYTYLGHQPFCVIESRGGVSFVDGGAVPGDGLHVLADRMQHYETVSNPDAPVPFCGGAMGFFGYELGWQFEDLPPPPAAGSDQPDMVIGLYDQILAFDHQTHRAFIICSDPRGDGGAVLSDRCAQVLRLIRDRGAACPVPSVPEIAALWRPDMSRDTYCARIREILAHIEAGTIYQANFTEAFRLSCPEPVDPIALFCALRRASPAPFAALIRSGPDLALVSASPERFLRLTPDGAIETRPIKGTARRDPDPTVDRRLAAALAVHEKDRAENLMIVDLMRNDLGRVAEVGSVSVPSLVQLETFASVHHLVSVVTARLRPGLGPCDLLRATFPGGSITGAPKIRAMAIIAALEASKRGAYCGAIGWIGFDRAMDTSITIRTMTVTPHEVIAQAGGGIVADSDPQAEYGEMRTKIAPLLRVLGRGCVE